MLALPVWAAASSNDQKMLASPPVSAATIGKYEFSLENGSSEKVCHDFLSNLKKTQPEETSLACEIKLDPSLKQFGLPEWKGLGNEEYWNVTYDIEKRISFFFYSNKEATKEEWLKDYTEKIRSGELKPRLRQAKVKLATGAPQLTIFGYTRHRDNIDVCKKNVETGTPQSVIPGELIYIHDKARKTLVELESSLDSETFFKNRVEHHVVTHNSNLFFLKSLPAADGYSVLVYGIDMNVSPADSGKKLYTFSARQFCRISARNTLSSTQ